MNLTRRSFIAMALIAAPRPGRGAIAAQEAAELQPAPTPIGRRPSCWQGPGIYEVELLAGPRLMFAEVDPLMSTGGETCIRFSVTEAERRTRGMFVMPVDQLEHLRMRKVDELPGGFHAS